MIHDAGTISEWSDLSELVRTHFKKGWIYRGVRSSSYGLRPGIGRPGARRDVNGLDLPYVAEQEQRLVRQFKREAQTQVAWLPASDLEWMILGQHHRLPTRLLDWSESILVAAFFAVEDPIHEAAIYGVETPPEITDLQQDPFSDELRGRPRLIRPPHISPRITAQQGVLTLHPQPDTDWTDEGIHRWIIRKEFTFTLKGLLSFCGVHVASVYPDSLDRHTEHLKWLYKRDRLSP
jgi:FRG domain